MAKLPQVNAMVPLQMIFKTDIVGEGLHTIMTPVGLFPCMLPHMVLHIGPLGETTVARWTLVGFFSLVNCLMFITMLLRIELFPTDTTLVWPSGFVTF